MHMYNTFLCIYIYTYTILLYTATWSLRRAGDWLGKRLHEGFHKLSSLGGLGVYVLTAVDYQNHHSLEVLIRRPYTEVVGYLQKRWFLEVEVAVILAFWGTYYYAMNL